jgi:hypothetical protein
MSAEPVYYWLVCKVCHKLHRGDMVMSDPKHVNFLAMRKDGKLECPDYPGKFGEYIHSDWKTATESEADKLLG